MVLVVVAVMVLLMVVVRIGDGGHCDGMMIIIWQ